MTVTTILKIEGRYSTLSITKQGNLLISGAPTVGEFYKIYECSTHGSLLREIVLPKDMKGLIHAIRLNENHILLTHASSASSIHRVCLVDNNAQLSRSYGGVRGSGDGQLDDPRELVVDENGFIFVSCFAGSKVVLLNSKLEYVRDIIPASANIRCINRICFDEYRRKIYVSDYNRKTISVFILH